MTSLTWAAFVTSLSPYHPLCVAVNVIWTRASLYGAMPKRLLGPPHAGVPMLPLLQAYSGGAVEPTAPQPSTGRQGVVTAVPVVGLTMLAPVSGSIQVVTLTLPGSVVLLGFGTVPP